MRHPLLVPDLRELIRDGETAVLRDFFAEHHPRRLAEIIDDLEDDDGDALFRILPPAIGPTSSATWMKTASSGSSRRCPPARRPNCST